MDHTQVSSVQFFGNWTTWPDTVVYVGMIGPASNAKGIPTGLGQYGKPWAFRDDPRGWPAAYSDYVAGRLLNDAPWADRLKSFHGKTLLCWCTAKQQQRGTEVPCHARILAEYVEMLYHADDWLNERAECPHCGIRLFDMSGHDCADPNL